MDNVKNAIRTVPDYPKPGILFYDITTILQDPRHLRTVIDALAERYAPMEISKVLAETAKTPTSSKFRAPAK